MSGKPVDHTDVEIVAGPSKPIQGVVRAADTGQPLAGVWIYGGNFGGEIPNDNMRGIRAMTDAQGHFRLEGMAKGNSYKLRVFPRDDQPYIMKELTIGDTQGLAPVETEIKLTARRAGTLPAGRQGDGPAEAGHGAIHPLRRQRLLLGQRPEEPVLPPLGLGGRARHLQPRRPDRHRG